MNNRRRALAIVATVAVALLTGMSSADVRLPGFFGEHMVLQQQKPIRIWGWAGANEAIEVSIGSSSASTKADESGRWEVNLPAKKASNQPHELRVEGNNSITIGDVLIGEVWLCSGQSNMEWTVALSTKAKQEIAEAEHPLIRHMKVAHRQSTVPLEDIQAEWQVCSSNTVGGFTACGYFMARRLQEELDVPIGLINSSWGGTRVEPWTPLIGFESVEATKSIYDSVIGRTPGSATYRERLAEHIAATIRWLGKAKQSLATGEDVESSPSYPEELIPFRSHQDPTMLYNGMIHALIGFPIRGTIWYQGESNHTEGMMYFEKKKALINGWRQLWRQGDFPFYYVQIAPFKYGDDDPATLARFWEAQAAVEQLKNTGMVVINDIATLEDIHPPNKQDVGHRLAELALKYDYGRESLLARGPSVESLEVLGGKLRLNFKNTGGGLETRDGAAPSHFEVIGPGAGGFHPAVAALNGDSVLLTCNMVSTPTAFRFAWHELAEPNLTGATGLPVGACRGGEVPEFFDTVPGSEEYELVYDLDLTNLGHQIKYDVDNSDEISEFSRIGYLLELESELVGDQKVFVVMDAFTTDIAKIGIPTAASQSHFQQPVERMAVYSNVSGIASGPSIASGNIEFWPNNYTPGNSASVPNASKDIYDFGDAPVEPRDGYGSMQVHNSAERQTLFSINSWKHGNAADLGIGNSKGNTRDWTFKGNASSYSKKRLRVFVRPK